MAWQTPKVNWQPSDYFNIDDWNRIKSNVEYTVEELHRSGYIQLSLQDISLDKSYSTMPYVSLVNNLEDNLDLIYNTFGVSLWSPWSKESWQARLSAAYSKNPSATDWNRWENVLLEVYSAVQLIQLSWFYSGEIYSGEV